MTSEREEKVLWRGEHVEVRERKGFSAYEGRGDTGYYHTEIYACEPSYHHRNNWRRWSRCLHNHNDFGKSAETSGRLTNKKRARCIDVAQRIDANWEHMKRAGALSAWFVEGAEEIRAAQTAAVSDARRNMMRAATDGDDDLLVTWARALRDALATEPRVFLHVMFLQTYGHACEDAYNRLQRGEPLTDTDREHLYPEMLDGLRSLS